MNLCFSLTRFADHSDRPSRSNSLRQALTRRRSRFLTTAPPTSRGVTVPKYNPSFRPFSGLGSTTSAFAWNQATPELRDPETVEPKRETRTKSARWSKTRKVIGQRRVGSLAADRDGQALTPFCTATRQNLAPIFAGHSCPESMCRLSTTSTWLVGSFHLKPPKLLLERSQAQLRDTRSTSSDCTAISAPRTIRPALLTVHLHPCSRCLCRTR
jgi:hypothetical protein